MTTTGYITYDELRQVEKVGAVGAMIGFYYNILGEHIPLAWLDSSVIGVSWNDLNRFGVVIGVAFGRVKVPAILGALRSGMLDILVIDDVAAEGVLSLA